MEQLDIERKEYLDKFKEKWLVVDPEHKWKGKEVTLKSNVRWSYLIEREGEEEWVGPWAIEIIK